MFRRRTKPPLLHRVWPRRGFGRVLRYYSKRILRLRATPHAIAAGVAAGVFAGFTPFLGLHIVMAAAIAWIIGGNLVASAIATFVCNPVTVAFMWGATYEVGRFILHGARRSTHAPPLSPAATPDFGHMITHLEFVRLGKQFARLWRPVLEPMAIGAIPVGIVFALAAYLLTRWGVASFQAERRRRMLAKTDPHDGALAQP